MDTERICWWLENVLLLPVAVLKGVICGVMVTWLAIHGYYTEDRKYRH